MGRRLGFGLSRELWIVEIGVFINMLGYGAVLPFEIIYLHDGRGFPLRTAGLVIGVVTGVAVVAAPLAGTLIDRIGARAVAAGAGAALAAGYAGLALTHSPGPAFVAAACAGAGNGALIPSQSTLLATLAPPRGRVRPERVRGVVRAERAHLRRLRVRPRRRRARRRRAGAGRGRVPGRAA
jgi:MFS family permease